MQEATYQCFSFPSSLSKISFFKKNSYPQMRIKKNASSMQKLLSQGPKMLPELPKT